MWCVARLTQETKFIEIHWLWEIRQSAGESVGLREVNVSIHNVWQSLEEGTSG